MYAKLKSNGQLQSAPNPLKVTISNPSDAIYEQFGWHKVIPAIPPAYDVDTEYVECHYEMVENDIVQVWEIHSIVQEEANE